MSAFDVVVVGSGHNGLTAAAYLAKAGKKVLILERSNKFGGETLTGEFVAPGFRHDLQAAFHVLIQADPLLQRDELGLLSQHGLSYFYPDQIFSTVLDDGDCPITSKDLDATCRSIARVCEEDAAAYRRFHDQDREILPLLTRAAFVPPLSTETLGALLGATDRGKAFGALMRSSMLDVVNRFLTHDKTKIHLLKCAAELLIAPDEPGTGAFVFNMAGLSHIFPWGIPPRWEQRSDRCSHVLPRILRRGVSHVRRRR